jgi:hypothetical protein
MLRGIIVYMGGGGADSKAASDPAGTSLRYRDNVTYPKLQNFHSVNNSV